jgi:hypothetical protein
MTRVRSSKNHSSLGSVQLAAHPVPGCRTGVSGCPLHLAVVPENRTASVLFSNCHIKLHAKPQPHSANDPQIANASDSKP